VPKKIVSTDYTSALAGKEAVSKDYFTVVLNPSPALPLSNKGRELNYYI
jgi:hypothetical protein